MMGRMAQEGRHTVFLEIEPEMSLESQGRVAQTGHKPVVLVEGQQQKFFVFSFESYVWFPGGLLFHPASIPVARHLRNVSKRTSQIGTKE